MKTKTMTGQNSTINRVVRFPRKYAESPLNRPFWKINFLTKFRYKIRGISSFTDIVKIYFKEGILECISHLPSRIVRLEWNTYFRYFSLFPMFLWTVIMLNEIFTMTITILRNHFQDHNERGPWVGIHNLTVIFNVSMCQKESGRRL